MKTSDVDVFRRQGVRLGEAQAKHVHARPSRARDGHDVCVKSPRLRVHGERGTAEEYRGTRKRAASSKAVRRSEDDGVQVRVRTEALGPAEDRAPVAGSCVPHPRANLLRSAAAREARPGMQRCFHSGTSVWRWG